MNDEPLYHRSMLETFCYRSQIQAAARTVILFALAVGSSVASAQSIRVIKAVGNRANVEFIDAETPATGQTFSIGADAPRATTRARNSGAIDHTIGASAELSALSDSASGLNNRTLSAAGRYGWNLRSFESGPIVAFSLVENESQSVRTVEAGGFFDLNALPNDGRRFVWGAGVSARLGSVARTRGRASFSNATSTLEGGPFTKWFLGGSTACLRGDLLLSASSASGDAPYATTSTGLRALAGLQVYF